MSDFHKPAMFDSNKFDAFGSGVDPAELSATATRAAHALLHHGRKSEDEAITARLVQLTDQHGLSLLSELWAQSPALTLPGTLWRIYTLRAVVRQEPETISEYFQAGRGIEEVSHAISGVAEPASEDEIVTMADAILTGAFRGDFAVALERFASFCRVVAVGQNAKADHQELTEETRALQESHRYRTTHPQQLYRASQKLVTTAEQLEKAAKLWRAGELR